jgi:hypothetical protein
MRFILPLTIAVAIIIPSAALAQFMGGAGDDTSAAVTQSFTASISPQYPAPYSQATLLVLSSTLDLTNATMAVSVNGKGIYQGSVQSLAIPLGKAGSMTSVQVTIASNGTSSLQTLSIQPEDVALVAEPVSSAPPLYPGKPLVPLEGETRVVAVANLQDANGKAVDPSTLSYAWTVDDTQIADSSGIGKDAIMVDSPLEYRSSTVSVAVQSQDGTLVGGDTLTLTASEPSVQIYENDPLLGILFDHALSGNYAISGAEDTLYAAPFSFPTSSGAPLLQWFLNGDAAQTGNSITLRPTGSGQGTASLSLAASAGESTRADEELSLSFSAAPSNGLFGL